MADATDRTSIDVLVIDDDADICLMIQELLEAEGYHTATAANGQKGLALLESMTPHLILLDLTMPVMDGARFRELQLRQHDLATIPTIVMTAHGRAREMAAPLFVRECLEKPLQLEQLLRVVGEYCRR